LFIARSGAEVVSRVSFVAFSTGKPSVSARKLTRAWLTMAVPDGVPFARRPVPSTVSASKPSWLL
jgi:hypothetical protein